MKWYHWLLLPIAVPYVGYLLLTGRYGEDVGAYSTNEKVRTAEHVCAVLKRDDGTKRVIESGMR